MSEGQTLEDAFLERTCGHCGFVEGVSAPLDDAMAMADSLQGEFCPNCAGIVLAPFRISPAPGSHAPER